MGECVLLCCSSSVGSVGERFGNVGLQPSTRHSAFGSDYSIVAPSGLRACGAWVRKSRNFILVSGRFGWVGLLASFGGFPLGLLVSVRALVALSLLCPRVGFLHGIRGCRVPCHGLRSQRSCICRVT